MASTSGFRVRRVYDPPEAGDGVRVLVDRLWPRGVSKEAAAVDEWPKEVTPSGELRKWLHANPERYDEFTRRYHAELASPELRDELARLAGLAAKKRVTLLTAVKEPAHSHVPVLLGTLEKTTPR
ncbi:Uncharacterized conserved protein YeaO, DUF488 family [Actinacidiphila yanglinensis]|uniref:Uncharacterized conserved protein YeaO, DUF488 family n=1 Tax=Actinacidiphila yanglinensis TaxID=310779 RepID=A0A1H5U0K2_9ACTN|nr:DUF488 family protein [Actinacidiphila yanglinensis]SEF68662.1 Uncharacterized conserved protein YeaO, DUF488 family [Actinacidiphila yanglinensis]